MLTKFPASNACAAIFKNTDSSYSSVKVTELSKFKHLFLLKVFISSLLMVVPSSLVSMERIKDGKVKLDKHFNIMLEKDVCC